MLWKCQRRYWTVHHLILSRPLENIHIAFVCRNTDLHFTHVFGDLVQICTTFTWNSSRGAFSFSILQLWTEAFCAQFSLCLLTGFTHFHIFSYFQNMFGSEDNDLSSVSAFIWTLVSWFWSYSPCRDVHLSDHLRKLIVGPSFTQVLYLCINLKFLYFTFYLCSTTSQR